MQIEEHVALVTGGASGLGEATVRALVSQGGKAVVVDRDAGRGEALAGELGDAVRFRQADVTDPDGMQQAVREAVEGFGALHFTVCCAGVGSAMKVLGKDGVFPLEDFNRVVQVNLIGTFNAIRLATEAMAANEPNGEGERGVIVTTASAAAFEGQIGQAAYTASKAGVAGMTLPIARELAAHGIRIVCIAPGLFDTPLLAGLPEEIKEALGGQVPFPSRLGRPSEFASTVGHILVSPMLNGETIRLDGAIRMTAR